MGSTTQGVPQAQINLGVCYGNGCGIAQNMLKAIELYVKAAKQGDTTAQKRLGGFYSKEKEITKKHIEDFASEALMDIDGNLYPTVKIGNQTWLTENFRAKRYFDGTPIKLLSSNDDWRDGTWETGIGFVDAYCLNNTGDSNHNKKYGVYYSWKAIDSKKLAPLGWHVPTVNEWDSMWTIMKDQDSIKLFSNEKSKSVRNKLGFSAVATGMRNASVGEFVNNKNACYWWTATEATPALGSIGGVCVVLNVDYEISSTSFSHGCGLPVRLVKDNTTITVAEQTTSATIETYDNSSINPKTNPVPQGSFTANTQQYVGESTAIIIYSIPPVADVYMDGKLIGKTNTDKLYVTSGTHSMRFVKGELEVSKEMTFTSGLNHSKLVKLADQRPDVFVKMRVNSRGNIEYVPSSEK